MPYRDEREHVFVVGSARSGTSLLSSIIKTSSEIASYDAETLLLYSCESKYGPLSDSAARSRFWNDWKNSRQYYRSGLSEADVDAIASRCDSYIAVLGEYMNLFASRQGCQLWIDGTPSNGFCLDQIAESFPNARVIHIVRDGRAVAASLAKLGWTGVRAYNSMDALCYSSLKWRAAVLAASESQRILGDRYLLVKYEDLVLDSRNIIDRVSSFLGLPELDTDFLDAGKARLGQNDRSTLHTPNTPFGDMGAGISTQAMERWRQQLNEVEIAAIEMHVGDTLRLMGYEPESMNSLNLKQRTLKPWRVMRFELHNWLKFHTRLGRYSSSPLEIGVD